MKICMHSVDVVFEGATGGVRRFLELAKALKQRKHEVTLLSADYPTIISNHGFEGDCIRNTNDATAYNRICRIIKKGTF